MRIKRTQIPSSNSDPQPYWKPWKRKESSTNFQDKLLIPLPISHPVFIAVSIYNRDSDQPIPTECDLCWDILRSIEDCYGDIQAMNSVQRYRGGGAKTDSSLDSLDSQSSGDTKDRESRDSVDVVGGSETLPMNRTPGSQITITANNAQEISETINNAGNRSSTGSNNTNTSYHWTLSNLEGANNQFSRRRNNSSGQNNNTETIRVDLASPESLEDSSRVFSAYGTTV